MQGPIYLLTPFTTLDFPDKIAAIAWFKGCNMCCSYCYNVPIVLGGANKTNLSEAKFIAFLDKRIGKLDGVVFSGGECTLSSSFLSLSYAVKQRNFALKVDTNGTNLSVLKTAINENLIDYIALDFKATSEKFEAITNSNLYDKFIKTLDFLLTTDVKFEVRTTLHADLLNENDISQMAQILYDRGYKGEYYLQKFLDTDENFGSLRTPKNSFNLSKINSKIPIKLRNFG